jgi:hypothetical protein
MCNLDGDPLGEPMHAANRLPVKLPAAVDLPRELEQAGRTGDYALEIERAGKLLGTSFVEHEVIQPAKSARDRAISAPTWAQSSSRGIHEEAEGVCHAHLLD